MGVLTDAENFNAKLQRDFVDQFLPKKDIYDFKQVAWEASQGDEYFEKKYQEKLDKISGVDGR